MLKSVGLQNFRSFRDVRVTLGRRNFLVGPNMSGKSNFFEVFRFLKRATLPTSGGWGLANAFPGGPEAFTWRGGDSNRIVIALEGDGCHPSDPDASWSYELSIITDPRGGVRVQDERFLLSRGGKQYSLVQREGGIGAVVNSDGRQLLGGVSADRSILEFEIPDWDGAFLRQWLVNCRFYRLSPQAMRNVNTAAAPRWLSETGDNLSAWLMLLQTRYQDVFSRIHRVCQDVLPDVVRLFSWPTEQGTVIVGSEEKHLKRPVPIWDMSDGELAFVALLSLIYSPPELQASTCFIEEPENFLHPRLIEVLLELLAQVQDGAASQEAAQVVATTHSPFLVDKVSLDELIVFQKREGSTLVSFPRDRAHLREMLEHRELGLGDLLYSGVLLSV